MTAAFLFVAALLLVGVVLRVRLAIFRLLYIPASVIAGAIGLAIVQGIALWFGSDDAAAITTARWAETLGEWPGTLIAIVFAGMLLERKPAPLAESLSRVGRQGVMVWVIVVGQTAIGLLATWLLIQPRADVPNSFGMLIETGFAGGHGTAAAMGQVYAHPSIGLDSGRDMGVMMATCGLVYGVLSGIVWVNIGVRRGWASLAVPPQGSVKKGSDQVDADRSSGGVAIGYAKVGGETIDPLLLQVVWLAIAFGIGIGLHSLVSEFVGFAEQFIGGQSQTEGAEQQLSKRMTLQSVADAFPLFIYTLFGGLIVRQGLRAVGHEDAIDRDTINRLTSSAMDILVVSAITTLNLMAVATLIVPFAILFVLGSIWAGICLLVIARWLLPREHWFQLGLINYGMSTGTTATGFVLLRLVDPELESGAAEDYALAAPLSSPFIGGGLLTVGLPLLVLEKVPIAVPAIGLSLLVIALIVLGRFWNSKATC